MRKIISIILLVTILFSLVGCKIGQKNKKDPEVDESAFSEWEDETSGDEESEDTDLPDEEPVEDKESDETDEEPDETDEEEDSPPKEPVVGPVGEWDIPVPKINPLGSQEYYGSTEYEMSDHNIKVIENFVEFEKTLSGEVWNIQMDRQSGVSLDFLKKYAKSLNADIYSTGYDDRLTFRYKTEENSMWWADIQQSGEEYRMTVVKEQLLLPGQERTFTPASMEDSPENITFITESNGKKFRSAVIKVPEGTLTLEITTDFSTGMLKGGSSYMRELPSEKTTTFILDDIPQGEGSYKWKFVWDDAPETFSVLLVEEGELPTVKLGNELGALKVTGVSYGDVHVEPQKNGYSVHKDYSFLEEYSIDGDITPEGDILFWLPAGLWNVVLEADNVGLEYSKVRLVPVSTGETTILSFPESLKSAYGNLTGYFADEENLTGGIDFVGAEDLGKNATISVIVNDPLNRDIFPTLENTTILEGGIPVKITDITRQVAPPSVVLVLDSSGSMGNQMPATIAAAKSFINGLPDKTYIRVIDFDTSVKVLAGSDKNTVLKNLSSISAGGSTTLFDATMKGLELLEEKTRPALVIFADGADSSIDGQGTGSDATLEEVLYAIEEQQIPIYAIGFGDKPDESAMRAFATTSKGEYYSAKDEKALVKVFDAIGSKFGNSFVMTYQRPEVSGVSDIPVVSFILDASGSMDTDPEEEEGCGYRIDKMKALFHEFILKLPKECLCQLTSFQTAALGGSIIRQEQVTTSDKVRLLQGLGEMEAYGGTPILASIRIGYESLRAVPTNKRVIVFLTDAALEVGEEDQIAFEDLLGEIKEENIIVLWAGMGVEDKEDVFIHAAELSGGRYVVSEDVGRLEAALLEILSLIRQETPAAGIPLTLSIHDQNDKGELLSFAANTSVNFSKPGSSGKVAEPGTIKLTTGLPLERYGKETAALVTGTGIPGEDTILTKKMPVDAAGHNDSAEIRVKETYYFSKFKGLEPPSGKQFMVLHLELKNITKDKIPYLIPSIQNHFYININNEGSYPASNATWLTEKPLSPPGHPEVSLSPTDTLTGMLVFIIPDQPITQVSFHFYDTASGHIQMPLIGKIGEQMLDVKNMITEVPAKITDAFSMSVTGYSDVDKVDVYTAEKDTSFRIVETKFDSKVQALLDIHPAQRFWLKINTPEGPLLTRLSSVTAAIPFGFMSPVMLAPGSSNRARLVYQIPSGLAEAPAELWGDLSSGELKIPVVKGSVSEKGNKPSITGDGLQVTVNRLVSLDDSMEGYNSYWVMADVTFNDVKDGYATVIPDDCFQLVREGYEEEYEEKTGAKAGNVGLGDFSDSGSSEGVLNADLSTRLLVYGLNDEWPVFDGSRRRGVLLFLRPEDDGEWSLRSPYFPDLNVPLGTEPYPHPELLVQKNEILLFDGEFETELDKLVQEAIKKYDMITKETGSVVAAKTIRFSGGDGKNTIPAPTIVASGVMKLHKSKTISDFVTVMKSLQWIPSPSYSKTNRYAPEAVLTQGWGTEWDLYTLGMALLSKAGATPTKKLLKLTQAGKKKLMETTGLEEIATDDVPGILYRDDKGQQKIFVIPFMKDIKELEGLVLFQSTQEEYGYEVDRAIIKVLAKVEPGEQTAAGAMGDISDILGGGDGESVFVDYIELLSEQISLPVLSLDAIDVGYVKVGDNEYTAFLQTAEGTKAGSYLVEGNKDKIIGIRIEIQLPNKTLTHEKDFAKEDAIDQYHHVIAVNLPDLPESAAKDLDEHTQKVYAASKDPDTVSALGWYGRNILHRFIAAQTQFDLEIGADLDLILGRVDKERVIIITAYMDTKADKLRTTMDLLQGANQCHTDDFEKQAAYNIVAGMFLSTLEGKALTGEERTSFIDVWNNVPQGSNILFIPTGDEEVRHKMALNMEESGEYPQRLLRSVDEGTKVIFTPDKPARIDGQDRWAWLEIDPVTYETISVFDTGEHAGMASYLLTLAKENAGDVGQYIVGALIGVEVSVWAVAAMSLELDDYDEILEAAMNLTAGIGGHLEDVMKGYGIMLDKTISYSTPGNTPINANFSLSLDEGYRSSFKQNIVGFSQGFNHGASLYFTLAKKANEKEKEKG